jgi:GGDEF domain-containing protein
VAVSGDRFADCADGAIERQPDSIVSVTGAPGKDRALAALDRILSDVDRGGSDGEQLLTDVDQTGAGRDQISADCDHVAGGDDQACPSDRALRADPDGAQLEFTRDVRERTTRQAARARLDAADQRDEIAQARDLAAHARDRAADARNLAWAQLEAAVQHDEEARALTGSDSIIRGAAQRKRAARQRAQAADLRALAAQDRHAAAQDREQAADERQRARLDREALVRQVASSALTGARGQEAGLTDLAHELDRCRQTSDALVLAYVDVAAAATFVDRERPGAGEELLRRVVQITREHLRPFDLIIHVGDDEFVCALPSISLRDVRRRFSEVAAALTGLPTAIRIAFAEPVAGESAAELIARAAGQRLDSPHITTTADQ